MTPRETHEEVFTVKALLVLPLALIACDLSARAVDPEAAKNLAEAEARLRAAPDDVDAMIAAGEAAGRAGQYFLAADRFKQAIERDAHKPGGYAGLAEAYNKLGFWQQSYETLNFCSQMPSGNEECLIRLGLMLRSDGSKEGLREARRILKLFLERAPNHARAADVARVVQQIEVQLGPEGAAEEAAPEQPNVPSSAPAVAGASPHGAGGPAPVIPEHQGAGGQEVGALNPFGVAIGRALDAIKKQDAATAETALKEALVIRPEDVGAHALLAETYLHLGKNKEAVASAEKAYALDPNDAQSRWVLGLVMIRTGTNIGKGVEAWRALKRDTPDYAQQLGVTQALEQAEKFSKEGAAPHAPKPQ